MLLAWARARPRQPLMPARRPAAHHLIGDLGVKLQPDRGAAMAESLVREISEPSGKQARASRQFEPVEVPLVGEARKPRVAQQIRLVGRVQGVITYLAAAIVMGIDPGAQ